MCDEDVMWTVVQSKKSKRDNKKLTILVNKYDNKKIVKKASKGYASDKLSYFNVYDVLRNTDEVDDTEVIDDTQEFENVFNQTVGKEKKNDISSESDDCTEANDVNYKDKKVLNIGVTEVVRKEKKSFIAELDDFTVNYKDKGQVLNIDDTCIEAVRKENNSIVSKLDDCTEICGANYNYKDKGKVLKSDNVDKMHEGITKINASNQEMKGTKDTDVKGKRVHVHTVIKNLHNTSQKTKKKKTKNKTNDNNAKTSVNLNDNGYQNTINNTENTEKQRMKLNYVTDNGNKNKTNNTVNTENLRIQPNDVMNEKEKLTNTVNKENDIAQLGIMHNTGINENPSLSMPNNKVNEAESIKIKPGNGILKEKCKICQLNVNGWNMKIPQFKGKNTARSKCTLYRSQ